MKICVMAITFNCRDVLPFWLRHYSTFADKIVAWDDKSTDGTREMLNAHPLVSVRDWPHVSGINEDVFLAHWYAEYPKMAGEFDWVMTPDPDEFLVPPQSRSMREVLESAAQWDVVASVGYNLTGTGFPKDDGRQIYEINPMGVGAPVYSKPICFKPTIHIRWMRGKHHLEHCNPAVSPPMLKLLHARYFGRNYTAQKNARNYDRCGDRDKGSAWSCAPTYHGEHSADWADGIKNSKLNALTAPL